MSEIILLTQEGYNEKDAELDNLIKVERPAAIEAVRVAREFGDLSENAEYDAAKDRQGRVESRIQELEYLLAHAKIISDGEGATNVIGVGSTVTLLDLDFDEESEFLIVSTVEADFFAGKISNQSLLGKALLGKKAGDVVEVTAPAGKMSFRIIKTGR